jgi:hypothetical protein
VVEIIQHGFDGSSVVAGGTPKAFLNALTGTVEYVLPADPGLGEGCAKSVAWIKNLLISQESKLTRPLNGEICGGGKSDVAAGKQFSEVLAGSMLRYQNRTLGAVQVMPELVACPSC